MHQKHQDRVLKDIEEREQSLKAKDKEAKKRMDTQQVASQAEAERKKAALEGLIRKARGKALGH